MTQLLNTSSQNQLGNPSPLLHLPARHPEYCDAERGSGAFKIPMRIVGADQAGRRAWQLTIQQEMSTVLKV